MRVTGGLLAGRRIAVPRRRDVRPTADRVRESMFARLEGLEGARVLDLFAGSGALGIEALSRGAAGAVFVDRATPCVTCVKENLTALELDERSTVIRSPARGALARLGRQGERFDVVFVDPPYASDEALAALEGVRTGELLAEGGLVVVEAHRGHDPGAAEGFRRTDERRYGDTVVAWYVREEPAGRPEGQRAS